MRIKNCILFLIISLLIISCKEVDPNKQIDEGNINGQTYVSQELGWKIEIPKGWKVITKKQNEIYKEKGEEVFEELLDGEIDKSGMKDLISFQKNEFNSLLSNSQPFDEAVDGSWKENNAALKTFLVEAFQYKGIKVDSTATTIIQIDGLNFLHYKFKLYGPKGNVILNQLIYARLMNGLDFGVNINYNNEEEKQVLLKTWFESKFKK